jgi:hypothetical protein
MRKNFREPRGNVLRAGLAAVAVDGMEQDQAVEASSTSYEEKYNRFNTTTKNKKLSRVMIMGGLPPHSF